MVTRAALRLVLGLLVASVTTSAGAPALWWALDSGPLSSQPELILTDTAPQGAVRVYGDHPDLEVDTAAALTVDALEAADGFDRGVLVVAFPTGSGWLDPDQVTATERWARGDVATVAMRYSSAPSAAVYTLRPDLATSAARALLTEITGRLRLRSPDERPALVVHGQSLGARAGSAVLADHSIAEFVDSALWQGRPGAATDVSQPEADPCTVSVVNPDDPVAALSWGLLRDPARAIGVLADLPGSDSTPRGTGHRYRPVLPPPGCVDVPT